MTVKRGRRTGVNKNGAAGAAPHGHRLTAQLAVASREMQWEAQVHTGRGLVHDNAEPRKAPGMATSPDMTHLFSAFNIDTFAEM